MKGVSHFRAWIFAALIMTSMAVAGAWPVAAAITADRFLAFCPTAVIQDFPTSGPAETTWLICWHEVRGDDGIAAPNGLVIGPVYFRKSPRADFVRILWDMRVSDYFVPYHNNAHRFFDISGYRFKLTDVTDSDCPAIFGGERIDPRVCKEVHDRGLMWRWPAPLRNGPVVRRGEELVLWALFDAANYRYIQEYTFRDDGVIIGRQGATGIVYSDSRTTPHAHNAVWRIDIDLNGVTNNAARLQHFENLALPESTARDTTTPITMAQGFTWEEETHDAVEITNPSFTNKQRHPASYQLVPLVTGGGRTQHSEKFTQNDFWVTPYNAAQFAAVNLPAYVAGSPSVANRDIVVWYKGSHHHHPRDEDGVFDQNRNWIGVTHVMWTGFMLEPHNFFDCSPFFNPSCP
jgi:primary-amine oxidase